MGVRELGNGLGNPLGRVKTSVAQKSTAAPSVTFFQRISQPSGVPIFFNTGTLFINQTLQDGSYARAASSVSVGSAPVPPLMDRRLVFRNGESGVEQYENGYVALHLTQPGYSGDSMYFTMLTSEETGESVVFGGNVYSASYYDGHFYLMSAGTSEVVISKISRETRTLVQQVKFSVGSDILYNLSKIHITSSGRIFCILERSAAASTYIYEIDSSLSSLAYTAVSSGHYPARAATIVSSSSGLVILLAGPDASYTGYRSYLVYIDLNENKTWSDILVFNSANQGRQNQTFATSYGDEFYVGRDELYYQSIYKVTKSGLIRIATSSYGDGTQPVTGIGARPGQLIFTNSNSYANYKDFQIVPSQLAGFSMNPTNSTTNKTLSDLTFTPGTTSAANIGTPASSYYFRIPG